MILETVCVGQMQANCYILAVSLESSAALIIDPGDQARKVKQVLDKHKLKPAFIVNTHGHYDHIAGDDQFGVPVYIHKQDLPLLREPGLNLSEFFAALPCRIESEIRVLEDGAIIKLDDIQLRVMHLPGHTPGGIALEMVKPADKIVFTGDTLFFHGIGRTDFAGGDESLLIKSIKERLLALDDDTVIYPGHGPSSTIGEEKRNNPFLSED